MSRDKKNLRRLSVLVTAQTAGNLKKLTAMAGFRDHGRTIDKLVREKMLSLRGREVREHQGWDDYGMVEKTRRGIS